jgi:YbbR domain-containing protein
VAALDLGPKRARGAVTAAGTATRPAGDGWRRNWGLKLLSVALAFAVWLYVNSQGQVTVNFAVPIEAVGLSPDLVLSDMSEATADVRVEGRENALARLTSRHIHAYLDLSEIQPGDQWVSLAAGDVNVAQPVQVTQVTPRQVRVKVAKRVTRAVQVVADVSGSPAAGRKVTAIEVEPPEVTVTGAEDAFKGLSRLSTAPVDLSGLSESIRREVRLDLRGRDLEVLEGKPVYVRITLSPPAPTAP